MVTFGKMDFSSSFAKLNIVYILWIASWILSGSLFEVYFFGLGMSYQELVLANSLWFLGALITIPLFRKIDSKKFMLVGIVMAFASVCMLYFIRDTNASFLFRFMVGLSNFFFWIPFNVMFYEFRKNNNATLGSVYYSIGPILTIILPGLGGFIATSFGYGNLFLAGLALYAITFILCSLLLENKKYVYDTVESIKSISGLKTLIFLEGFSAAVIMSVLLEVMLLKYIDKPLEFGTFVSLATGLSVAISLITSKLSDMRKRRREFLVVSAVVFGIFAIFTSTATTVAVFFLGFALISFIRTIFFPLPLALVVDNSKNLVNSMIGRELMLNLGRGLGAIFVFLILFKYDLSYALFAEGVIMLVLYPLVFEIKKKKLEKI